MTSRYDSRRRTMPQQIKALEFFAGIGLARAGMQQSGIEVVWANDLDATKCAMYTAQWGDADLCRGDVFEVNSKAGRFGCRT